MIICDCKISIKLKGKFYRTTIRPVILYGSEWWALKGQHERKMRVVKIRMLRWISKYTKKDKF